MDADRFDRLVLILTQARTRRSLLGMLGALGLTGLLSEEVWATHTPGDCLHNGVRCGGSRGTCCSGRCVRKRGTNKKFCRAAPSQGICTIESDQCQGSTLGCDEGGTGACRCWVTSGGHSLCAGLGNCFACETDAQCEKRFGGLPGERCAQCPGCPGGRVCVAKCPNPA